MSEQTIEKVKVGVYLKAETKENMNKLKEFGKTANPTLDTLLAFNREGLIEYVRLCSLFQEKEEWELITDEMYCTTVKEDLKIKKSLGSMSSNSVNKMLLDVKLPYLERGKIGESEDSKILDRMVRLTKATEFLIKNEKRHDTEIEKLEKRVLELESRK